MKKQILILSILTLAQFIFSAPVYAHYTVDECEKMEKLTKKRSLCFDNVKEVLDRKLQTWVNNHALNLEDKALITGRHSTLKMFKRSQHNFVTFRENDCRWQYLAISPKKGADITYVKCYILATKNRIKTLSMIP